MKFELNAWEGPHNAITEDILRHRSQEFIFRSPFKIVTIVTRVVMYKAIHLVCKPSVKRTSSFVIVRSSPGVAVFPVMALTPISTARPTVPLVEYQYRISSGVTWIIETRGSLASPL